MAKGLKDFMAIASTGFAKPSLFEVEIKPPPALIDPSARVDNAELRKLSYLCNNVQIPGLTMVTSEKALDYISRAKQKVYDDITLTFHCTEGMEELKFFQNWMNLLVNPVTNRVGYHSDYGTGSIEIFKLGIRSNNANNVSDEDNIPVMTTTIFDAYPKRIEPITLDYSTTGNILSLAVSFSYRYYNQKFIKIQETNRPSTKETLAAQSVDTELNKINPILEVLDPQQNFKFRGDTPGSQDALVFDEFGDRIN